jgi:hypothetical protein
MLRIIGVKVHCPHYVVRSPIGQQQPDRKLGQVD